MSKISGVVFVGPSGDEERDNVIRIQLYEDGAALHSKYTPAPTLTRFVLTLGALTLDSAVPAEAAAFSYTAETSTLELRLSAYMAAAAAAASATLTVYSDDWPHGVVWIHPSATPDKLSIAVVAV